MPPESSAAEPPPGPTRSTGKARDARGPAERRRPYPRGDRRPDPGKQGLPLGKTRATPARPCPSVPVIEGVLLAEIPKVLLLLLSQGAEQLALAPAPAFAHGENVGFVYLREPGFHREVTLSNAGWPTRFTAEADCRKVDPLYAALVRQTSELSGPDSAP